MLGEGDWLARSTPAVGSSSTSSSGSQVSARAMSTRCCWPPDSVRRCRAAAVGQADGLERGVDGGAGRPARGAAQPRQRGSRPGGDDLAHRGGHAGGGAGRAAARSRCRVQSRNRAERRAEQLEPCRRSAAAGRGAPGRAVDLPEPLAPSTATTSPGATPRSTSRRPGGRRRRRRPPRSADEGARSSAAQRGAQRVEVGAHRREVVAALGRPLERAEHRGASAPTSRASDSATSGLTSSSKKTVVTPSASACAATSASRRGGGLGSGTSPVTAPARGRSASAR